MCPELSSISVPSKLYCTDVVGCVPNLYLLENRAVWKNSAPRNSCQKFNVVVSGNVLYLSSISVLKIYLENCAEKVLPVKAVRTSISVLYGLEICAGYGLY